MYTVKELPTDREPLSNDGGMASAMRGEDMSAYNEDNSFMMSAKMQQKRNSVETDAA